MLSALELLRQRISVLKFQDNNGTFRKKASVLVPLQEHPHGVQVLLTRRSLDLRSHPGEVCFPGGQAESGETYVQTALREAEEEIALPPHQVTIIGRIDQILSKHGLLVTPVIGIVPPDFVPVPNPSEVDLAFSVPLEFFASAGNSSFDISMPMILNGSVSRSPSPPPMHAQCSPIEPTMYDGRVSAQIASTISTSESHRGSLHLSRALPSPMKTKLEFPVTFFTACESSLRRPPPPPNVLSPALESQLVSSRHASLAAHIGGFPFLMHFFRCGNQNVWGLTALLLIRLVELGFGIDLPYRVHQENSPTWMEIAQQYVQDPSQDEENRSKISK
mmetsp:Transcript_44749/g.72865  ORF Transcript_44749/g.72865 Transcript_44749/m.72865 type:complete len:333 (-) Transcript_44749:3933-4931(-)